ncbi:hypothetical protein JAAARDRAFT_284774 [Jaapia argillacea MUCL 33604]|uniref:DUF6534 domain-containing protein n=1 Tax=Jaapia argillacea MUCL 33604 TaxID=933084 RepID=A0A067PQT7_9AGAM|nr:hypothetical protein JAAARDRAFT_284774 [Jaapia argillacea MUCL 33604]
MAGITPGYILAHPENYLGPQIMGTIVQAFQTGILVEQSAKFWSRAQTEPIVVKALVTFVSVLALFQTGISIYQTWYIVVRNFGSWMALFNFGWPDKLSTLITMLMATPVQAFLIWRCYILLNKRLFFLLPLAALLLGYIAVSTVVTVNVFGVNLVALVPPTTNTAPPKKFPPDITFILSLAFPAALDIVVTGTLITFLLRSRSTAYTHKFRRVIHRLIRISWEAAVPPCACAILCGIIYGTNATRNFWNLFLQAILGKLYVMSLFRNLNGRADLKHTDRPTNVTAALPSFAVRVPVTNHEESNSTQDYASAFQRPNPRPDIEILSEKGDGPECLQMA